MVGLQGQSLLICHSPFVVCPSHLILSRIIALESGIKPHYSYSLLFVIRSVSQVPKTIHRQFIWKTFSKSSSVFRSAQASRPYLTTVISVASKIVVAPSRLRPTQLRTLLLQPNLFKASLPGSSNFLQIFIFDILPTQTRTTCFPCSSRRLAKKDNLRESVILHP